LIEDAQDHRISDEGAQVRLPVRQPDLGVDTKVRSVRPDERRSPPDRTGEIKYYPLSAEFNDFRVQMNFVGLRQTRRQGLTRMFRPAMSSVSI
jgi:hypothetical protein